MMTPEAMTFASERLAAEMIDRLGTHNMPDDGTELEWACICAMASATLAMATLVAADVLPAEAAQRLRILVDGIAQDLA
jgi:hypothetical protein